MRDLALLQDRDRPMAAHFLQNGHQSHGPAWFGAADQASELSRDDILQHGLVERQVRNQALQLRVLFLKLTQALHLGRHQAGVLLAPIIVSRLADPCLATHLAKLTWLLRMESTREEFVMSFIAGALSQTWLHRWHVLDWKRQCFASARSEML